MRLADLLYKVYENTTVWIAEDPANSVGIYFGPPMVSSAALTLNVSLHQ